MAANACAGNPNHPKTTAKAIREAPGTPAATIETKIEAAAIPIISSSERLTSNHWAVKIVARVT
jgi:hypothetical protein